MRKNLSRVKTEVSDLNAGHDDVRSSEGLTSSVLSDVARSKELVHPAGSEKKWLAAAIGGTALCMACATFIHFYGPLAMHELVRDMAASAQERALHGQDFMHPMLGAVSSVGVWILITAFGIAMFACCVGRRDAEGRVLRRFLIGLSLISLMLAIDDQFMVHDRMAGWYLHVSEKAVLAVEALFILGVLCLHRSVIKTGGILSLCFTIGFGLISVIHDQSLAFDPSPLPMAIEDGSKLAAMSCWLVYVARVASVYLKPDNVYIKPARA